MNQEIELKLALAPKTLKSLRTHPLVLAAKPQGRAQNLTSVYYDTPDLALRKADIGLRTRKEGRKWVQTVKCAAPSVGGLSSRKEWECQYLERFNFELIDQPQILQKLNHHLDEYVTLFTTRFRRETYLYQADNGAEILIMIDHGLAESGQNKENITELELELVKGQEEDLYALANLLSIDLPLIPCDESKAAKGYRLYKQEPHSTKQNKTLKLDPKETALQTFIQLAQAALSDWQANVLNTQSSHDPFFLHKTYQALTDLINTIQTFSSALPSGFVAAWHARLAGFAQEIEPAHRFDRFLTHTLAPVMNSPLGEKETLAILQRHVINARDQVYKTVHTSIEQARQGRFMLTFAQALNQLQIQNTNAEQPLNQFASTQIKRLTQAAQQACKQARARTPETLHEFELTLQTLCYASTLFAPVLNSKSSPKKLKALQKALDKITYAREFCQNFELLNQWSVQYPSIIIAVAWVNGWNICKTEEIKTRLPKKLKRLLKV